MSESEDDSDSALELSSPFISFEEPNHINGTKMHSMLVKKTNTPNDSKDDGAERIKRMRGLEDLGMGVESKRKAEAPGLLELVQQDNASLYGSNNGHCLSNGDHSSLIKRKRSQLANVHKFSKRKYHWRPLTKVLASTALVSVPVVCGEVPSSSGLCLMGLSDKKFPGMDFNESGESVYAVINNNNTINNSDNTGISCENCVSNTFEHVADVSQISNTTKDDEIFGIPGILGQLFDVPFVEDKPSAVVSCPSAIPEVGDLGRRAKIEGHNESGFTRLVAIDTNSTSQRMEEGATDWQLKGKRKMRQISKFHKRGLRKYVHMDDESKHSYGFSRGSDQKVEEQLDGFQDCKSMSQEPRVRGPIVEAKILPGRSMTPRRSLLYHHCHYTVNSRYLMTEFHGITDSTDSSLYDVRIEVKANYRPQHVQLVSLVSKVNGKALIGHPLTVEVSSDDCYYGDLTHEVAMECTEVGHLVKQNPGGLISTKHMKMEPRFPSHKSAKVKKTGLSSKKIRKLISLNCPKPGVDDWKLVTKKFKGHEIACIAVKLAFSRINEALNNSNTPRH
ncbi:hypothetical protein ES332_A09G098100v1 [Gossypium tomentosum]|uniref:Uncharacterized protein n=1 Tax=Gossypium tomentosum TaxID=34277 RepID=A0A5D2P232_GOSTO|nr:hypothetical protein ES332_A09G098100v1 [Gossypium tomentosum]TYI09811.1 hypothetical protein ES332_A09G098100v1 [Gossypium tomentosum]TYI09815.1 hypothetical protein ES332_A09G098100v1 [Gossypium tomentosum]